MHATVMTTERLTPNLIRVVLGGDGLRDFAMPETTDTYVNLAFPALEATTGPSSLHRPGLGPVDPES